MGKVKKNPLFEKTPRSFRIGGAIQPRVNLSRVVKWPKYVTLQRKKAILLKRLKSPPAVNQFNSAIDKNQAGQLLRLLKKYSPETKEAKKQRLLAMAKAQEGGGQVESKKPLMLKYGLNHVTSLIEGKARLGTLVNKKTSAVVAVTSVKREDQSEFEKLCENFKASFNDNADHRRRWGGGIMGMKSQHKTAKIQKAKDAEEAKKMGMMA